jgi:ZIP family zinc transporter
VLEAGFWGLVAGCALLVGAVVGLVVPIGQRTIGLVMGFGAGVLISALAFELTEEAFRLAGFDAVAVGLALGGVAFFLADLAVDRRGGAGRKRSGGEQEGGSAKAIAAGALLDGVPESIAIGISLVGGGTVGLAVVAAVFLSNVPESLSAAVGLRKAGHSVGYVLGLWGGVMLVSGLAAAAGYGLLGGLGEDPIATIQAFAAGAILTMLADTMMPESFEHGGPAAGLVTVLGFALAFLLTTLEP